MAQYELTFTPACPYFFGNEKSFKYPGQQNGGAYSNSYYIRSEDMPSQSTILGAIRYMMLPHLWGEDGYDADENTLAAGKESFQIKNSEKQDFGRIRKISPVYLRHGEEKLIPVPLNHIAGRTVDGNPVTYHPFLDFGEADTADGKKLYSREYDVKIGLASGFISLTDGRVYPVSSIITSANRIGINRQTKEDGFFKKEYKALMPGYSFAVIAELDSEPVRRIVTLGQGRSPFAVSVNRCDKSLEAETEKILAGCPEGYTLVYCLGDSIICGNPCDDTVFAAYQTKDYRSYTTEYNGKQRRVLKGDIMYRLVKAGSIFILSKGSEDAWLSKHHNTNAESIGMNSFVVIGGSRE